MRGIGRDVPLPPEPGRFWRAKTEQLRSDDDPIGPEERRCSSLARTLAPWTLGLVLVAQLGVLTAVAGLSEGGGLASFLWWASHRTFEGGPELDLGHPLILVGGAVVVLGLLGSPTAWFVRLWLLHLVPRGGWYGDRQLREVGARLGEAALEVSWAEVVDREIALAGARPESVIRWVRAVRAPPDPERRRRWMVALREHLKDGEGLAQAAMVREARGGIAEVTFAGRSYEAAELTTLTRRAAEGLRDLLATLPPT